MLGNFTYCNPTKLYFGRGAVESLKEELQKYGDNVLLVYGGGSIRKNGIYDEVVAVLREAGKKSDRDTRSNAESDCREAERGNLHRQRK